MKNDGGPAFPYTAQNMMGGFGMSLRDWFAGQALAGILANGGAQRPETANITPDVCWKFADAMLAERAKGE